jgi:hypothetical protein
LTHRSIRIALLPNPKISGNAEHEQNEYEMMKEFNNQLRDVVIDVMVPKLDDTIAGTDTNATAAIVKALKTHVLNDMGMDRPDRVLVVSDRDDYLRAGKELGMLTCRLQSKEKNARRGNVTAHYTCPSIQDVQDVVNEINGISFNAVLNR